MRSLKAAGQMSRTSGLVFVLLTAVAGSTTASAQTLTTLASFTDTDGAGPTGGLVTDANGDLFGTTADGGPGGYGTVFEIVNTSSGFANAPTTLVSFDGSDGANPRGSLVVDANGDLFGVTESGGASNFGTVFEIARTNTGYASTPTSLVTFNGSNGAYPIASLMSDANGDLFGTTYGSNVDWGTVFEIPKTNSGYGTLITLVSFNFDDGAWPYADLIADANGDLFGTTYTGGVFGDGTVFEIAKTTSGYANAPITLASFDGIHGLYPDAGLVADTNGNLFGTTWGGGSFNDGTVFEVAYDPTTGSYASIPTVLVNFNGENGENPYGSLIVNANGDLFGTTLGGSGGFGTAFELAYESSTGSYAASPVTLVSFDNKNGAAPETDLVADVNGDLFGTTTGGGAKGFGTVFDLTGSGFVAAGQFAGTPGTPNCVGSSVSALAQTYGGVAHAAPALGYASVSALQSVISSYCSN